MTAFSTGPMSGDRWLLLLLAGLAGALLMGTPHLIEPYSAQQPWYESPALFPRLALALALAGGVCECVMRRRALDPGGSDELDSSAASMPLALAMMVLFSLYMLAVPRLGYLSSSFLFLLTAGRLLAMSWRATLILALSLSLSLWGAIVLVLKVSFGHGLAI
jgi:hypothetical protein